MSVGGTDGDEDEDPSLGNEIGDFDRSGGSNGDESSSSKEGRRRNRKNKRRKNRNKHRNNQEEEESEDGRKATYWYQGEECQSFESLSVVVIS